MHVCPTLPHTRRTPLMCHYQQWLAQHYDLHFDSYDALWRWSTTDLEAFWQSIWRYFDIQSPTPHSAALGRNCMPGAQWFPGAQVNYAQQVLRHVEAADAAGMPAVIADNELGEVTTLSWPELRRQVAALALHLQAQGIRPGDRVAAYLPNIPQAMVAMLAVVSIGAVWSVCSPDMGTAAVLDRFEQIAPKALIAVDGVYYAGKPMDRSSIVQELRARLPACSTASSCLHAGRRLRCRALRTGAPSCSATMRSCTASPPVAALRPPAVDCVFQRHHRPAQAHRAWPRRHHAGGPDHEGPAQRCGLQLYARELGERFHWYSSTGWVMWNSQLAGLLGGTTCVIYDGSPGGSKEQPDWGVLWRFAARHAVTSFGAGAAFYANCMKAGIELSQCGDLSRITSLGSTGSPLSPDVQHWGTQQFAALGTPDIWWNNISGGTDFCGAFIGGNRELPQYPGEMQCRMLGAAVEAWDEQGRPVIDAVGELVCTQPIPSMPLYFWGDADRQRYLSSYFDMYPPGHGRQPGGGDGPADMGGVWRHGDWLLISAHGGCTIYGRSDATINRHGLRMGTSEIYRAVEALPEVLDSMVVDLEYLGRESFMPMFVVLRDGLQLDDALREQLADAIRTALSPRFVPDEIVHVPEIPRTLTGKKQELPIKKLLLGQPLEKVVNKDTMANPASLQWFVAYAQRHAARHTVAV